MAEKRESRKQEKKNNTVQFIVSRGFAGGQTMQEARLNILLNGRHTSVLRKGVNGKPDDIFIITVESHAGEWYYNGIVFLP